MEIQVLPYSEGQICRIINPLPDEDPEDVYIVSEDPSPYASDANIYVANLRDVQRNLHSPGFVSQMCVKKSELTVIADNLEEYIASWNAGN